MGFLLTYENLKAWCGRENLAFEANDAARQLAIRYRILGKAAPLVVMPLVERELVVFMVRLPVVVPAGRAAAVTAALGRLNARIYMGAWVLNDGGEVLFRVTLPATSDAEYGDAAVRLAARVAVSTAEAAAEEVAEVAR